MSMKRAKRTLDATISTSRKLFPRARRMEYIGTNGGEHYQHFNLMLVGIFVLPEYTTQTIV
jgi:hypothetical protein